MTADLAGSGAPVSDIAAESVNIGGIALTKSGAPNPVAAGDPLVYTFTAANSGAIDLESVLLVDDDPNCNGALVFQGGDADSDGLLNVGELWTWDCTVAAVAPGPMVNTGTVTANLAGLGVPVADNASETVNVGAILLTKSGAPDPVDDAAPLTYTFSASNGGMIDLENVLLADSDAACDAALTPLGGDADSDSVLDLTEIWTWECVITAVAPGPIVNTGTVTANLIGAGPPVLATADASVDVNPPAPLPSDEPSIRLSDSGTMEWTGSTGAIYYHLYRGDLQTLRESDVYTQDDVTREAERGCWLTELSYDDGYLPEPGRPVFYLVTSDQGSIESDLGEDSSGVTRPNDNPCR